MCHFHSGLCSMKWVLKLMFWSWNQVKENVVRLKVISEILYQPVVTKSCIWRTFKPHAARWFLYGSNSLLLEKISLSSIIMFTRAIGQSAQLELFVVHLQMMCFSYKTSFSSYLSILLLDEFWNILRNLRLIYNFKCKIFWILNDNEF